MPGREMFEDGLRTLGSLGNDIAAPLRLVLAEILPLADKVSTWVTQRGGGNTGCRYNIITNEPESYRIVAQPGNLGNIVHELTHVAVNEAYGLDFVNYPNPNAQNVPARVYQLSGYLQDGNEEARQLKLRDPGQDQERRRRVDDLIAKANAARAYMGDAHCNELVEKLSIYAAPMAHVEFDTVINQTFVWLHEWASRDSNRAAMNRADIRMERARLLNQADIRMERARLGRVTRPGSDPMKTLFNSLAGEVAAGYERRKQGRLARTITQMTSTGRPRSKAIGSADDAKPWAR